jgi:hypothetical protein
VEDKNMEQNFGFIFTDRDTLRLLDNTKTPVKVIQGTPWYTPISNQLYMHKWCYVGASTTERWKLIEDELDDGELIDDEISHARKKILCEQSDLTMILMNLAYIPDEVIKDLKDFKHGW